MISFLDFALFAIASIVGMIMLPKGPIRFIGIVIMWIIFEIFLRKLGAYD